MKVLLFLFKTEPVYFDIKVLSIDVCLDTQTDQITCLPCYHNTRRIPQRPTEKHLCSDRLHFYKC